MTGSNMKAIGTRANAKGKGSGMARRVAFTKVNGKMTNQMGMG